MNKGQRAGSSAIKIELKKANLTFGVVVGKVPSNHFAMAHIKDLNLTLLYIKQN